MRESEILSLNAETKVIGSINFCCKRIEVKCQSQKPLQSSQSISEVNTIDARLIDYFR